MGSNKPGKLEVEQALKVMDEAASKAKPRKPLTEVIREYRDLRK
ncbi:hypothetical protein [Vulcanisaeta thermophila]|nr:hypothetical protein [Vulcanisaeta thermophila]